MIETENELPEEHRRADACVMVIFGATGDLTKRKLLPALYNLARQGFFARRICVRRRGAAGDERSGFSAKDRRRSARIRFRRN